MKTEYSIKELDRVLKYVNELNRLGLSHGIRVDSLADQFVALDGEETVFTLRTDDENELYVSIVVPL